MPEHEALYQEGLFTGMEVVNHNEWYPEVLTWARDKNLTLFANSDVHDPILNFLQLEKLERRPITLVFARKETQKPSGKPWMTGVPWPGSGICSWANHYGLKNWSGLPFLKG